MIARSLAGLALVAACSASPAAENPWFVGAYAYRSDHDYFVGDSSSSWSVAGGRRFFDYFFVEATYNHFGSFDYRNIPVLAAPTFVQLHSIGVAFGARLPVFSTGLSLSVATGPHFFSRAYEVRRDGGSASIQPTYHGTDVWYSAGIAYQVSDRISLNAAWSRYRFGEGPEDERLTQRGLGMTIFF
jgi:hypothetical protein